VNTILALALGVLAASLSLNSMSELLLNQLLGDFPFSLDAATAGKKPWFPETQL
jgi:hypothetical protein